MEKLSKDVVDVILYQSATDKNKNRGFAFVEFRSHQIASAMRKKLINEHPVVLWGQQLQFDWAEPEQEPDADIMNKVEYLLCSMKIVL